MSGNFDAVVGGEEAITVLSVAPARVLVVGDGRLVVAENCRVELILAARLRTILRFADKTAYAVASYANKSYYFLIFIMVF